MKKKYGIGFFIGSILLSLILICAYRFSYDHVTEKIIRTEGNAQKEEGYMIKEEDGYVIVYLSDGETVYEYTSIRTDTLPENVRREVKNGKMVENVKQVYGFLENYSS